MAKEFEEMFDATLENLRRFNEFEEEYGSVVGRVFNRHIEATNTAAAHDSYISINLALTQQAYFDGPVGETPVYKAHAIDKEGNEYEVTWDVVDHWQELEDESLMCDWDNPANVDRI